MPAAEKDLKDILHDLARASGLDHLHQWIEKLEHKPAVTAETPEEKEGE